MEKEINQILDNLNKAFEPITNDIDNKLKFLQSYIQDNRDLSFKPLTMEDITKE